MTAMPYSRQELGIALAGGHTYQELAQTVKLAEENGFASCWIAEDYYFGGAMATAGALAAMTSRIHIGIGVVNPFTRAPELTAMEAAAVDAISGGRFILAMGSSNKRWIEDQMKIPFVKPITAATEAVQMIKQLISTGELDFSGQVLSAQNVKLSFTPCRRDMPVYMGVKGERALRLAGAHADGVLVSFMCSAPYIKWARGVIDQGAKEAGRDPSEIKISAYMPLFIGDYQEGKRSLVNTLAYYVARTGDQPFMQQSGITPEEYLPIRELVDAGKDATHLVTDEMVEKFTLIGDADHCRARLQEYKEAGLDEPVFCEYEKVTARMQLEMAINHLF